MKRLSTYYRNHKGITLVLMAILLAVLLMFGALAIDIAYMYVVKNQLQVAADAAALAGAAKLDGTSSTLQLLSRQAAWQFACKNKAAANPKNVFLVTKPPDYNSPTCDSSDTPSNLNNGNASDGDIVVGYWNGSSFNATIPSGGVANAIRVVGRRTGETPGMPRVNVFLGQVFRFIGADWSSMTASASAVAARPPRPTAGITICEPACGSGFDLSQPFMFNNNTPGNPYSAAWTEFDENSSIPAQTCMKNANKCDSGLESDCATDSQKTVASYIWQMKVAPAACMRLTWKNGLSGARFDLACAFESLTFDAGHKTDSLGHTPPVGSVDTWNVIVAVSPICPSGTSPGSGPYDITQFAEIAIDDVVNTSGHSVITGGGTPAGIKIKSINCFPCGDWYHLGHQPALVR